jgi:hypothetical protein
MIAAIRANAKSSAAVLIINSDFGFMVATRDREGFCAYLAIPVYGTAQLLQPKIVTAR